MKKNIIKVGICFDAYLGKKVNDEASKSCSNCVSLVSDSIIKNSVIRFFRNEETKEAYMTALNDTHSDWVELNEPAIKSISKIKKPIKWKV